MDEDFEDVPDKIKVRVKDMSYVLFDPDPAGPENRGMSYTRQIVWSDESVSIQTGSVINLLTAGELAGLQNLMNRLRVKSENNF